jgi:hypothetical protein
VPATLPHGLGSDCLQAPPPLGSALPKPHPPATAPAGSTHHHPCAAGVRRQSLTAQLPADARSVRLRPSDVSCVIIKRLGASDAAPAAPIQEPARTATPRLAPRKAPTAPTGPRARAPAHSTQLHLCIAGVPKHPLTAQLPADAHSIPPRSSDISCAIRKRLGASDAAPAVPIRLSARTASPRLATHRTPSTPTAPP